MIKPFFFAKSDGNVKQHGRISVREKASNRDTSFFASAAALLFNNPGTFLHTDLKTETTTKAQDDHVVAKSMSSPFAKDTISLPPSLDSP